MSNIKVLIVDDHTVVREGISIMGSDGNSGHQTFQAASNPA